MRIEKKKKKRKNECYIRSTWNMKMSKFEMLLNFVKLYPSCSGLLIHVDFQFMLAWVTLTNEVIWIEIIMISTEQPLYKNSLNVKKSILDWNHAQKIWETLSMMNFRGGSTNEVLINLIETF